MHWTEEIKKIVRKYGADLSGDYGDTMTVGYHKLGQGSIISQEIQDALLGKVVSLTVKLIPSDKKLEITVWG